MAHCPPTPCGLRDRVLCPVLFSRSSTVTLNWGGGGGRSSPASQTFQARKHFPRDLLRRAPPLNFFFLSLHTVVGMRVTQLPPPLPPPKTPMLSRAFLSLASVSLSDAEDPPTCGFSKSSFLGPPDRLFFSYSIKEQTLVLVALVPAFSLVSVMRIFFLATCAPARLTASLLTSGAVLFCRTRSAGLFPPKMEDDDPPVRTKLSHSGLFLSPIEMILSKDDRSGSLLLFWYVTFLPRDCVYFGSCESRPQYGRYRFSFLPYIYLILLYSRDSKWLVLPVRRASLPSLKS